MESSRSSWFYQNFSDLWNLLQNYHSFEWLKVELDEFRVGHIYSAFSNGMVTPGKTSEVTVQEKCLKLKSSADVVYPKYKSIVLLAKTDRKNLLKENKIPHSKHANLSLLGFAPDDELLRSSLVSNLWNFGSLLVVGAVSRYNARERYMAHRSERFWPGKRILLSYSYRNYKKPTSNFWK